jgi:hypothetical protein
VRRFLQAYAQKTGNTLRPFRPVAGGAFKGSGPEFSKDDIEAKRQAIPTEDLRGTKIEKQKTGDAVRASRKRQRGEAAATRDMLDGHSEAP